MAKSAPSNEDEVELDYDGRQSANDNEIDEDDGLDQYENDGFIVDHVDEEEERADSDEERQKKKKRKKKEEYILDEDDYELLQDNNITSFQRPKEAKKYKRLKKAGRDNEERSGFVNWVEVGGSDKNDRTAKDKLKHSLFGDDEGPFENIAEEEEQAEEDAIISEEDEMADFIVDEEETDENGAPVRRKLKKKTWQASGVSSFALQEARDIFGDVDEFLLLHKQGLDSNEWREKRLEDEFEPVVLSEKYMTEKDDRIREADVPERMQISETTADYTPTIDSIKQESSWICKQLSIGMVPLLGKRDARTSDINKEDVMRFLDLHRMQKLDIPFIAMYRKEECPSLLKDSEELGIDEENQHNNNGRPDLKWHKVLWSVLDLDRKWVLLQKRKSALNLYYSRRFEEESRHIYDETRLTLNQKLYESIIKSLKCADSERDVDDVDLKFNLHFPPGEVEVDEGQYKRPKRKSQYSISRKAGLWEVANKFGYNSEQFGLQISLEKMREDELEDGKEIPEEVASDFTCKLFETSQDVLKGARHMAAVEISCEPSVRKYIRSIFMENAVVSTNPTPDGSVAVDSFHQFAGVKWLREKPLNQFEDAQWLLIQKAEEEKLLQVTIKLPEQILNKLINDFNEYYLSMGVSKSTHLWNEQRKMILHDSLFVYLLPSMEKEARSLLTSKAKSWLLLEYGRVLWNKVSVGPYQRKENHISSDDE